MIAKQLISARTKVQEIFRHYAQESALKTSTFEERNTSVASIDLKIFLTFIREFSVLTKLATIYEVTTAFKKLATNSIWMNEEQFEQFVKWLHIIETKGSAGRSQEEIDVDFTQYIRSGIGSQARMDKVLNPVSRK